MTVRSRGFGHLEEEKEPFANWRFTKRRPPYCFLPMREDYGSEVDQGLLSPEDFTRMEIPKGPFSIVQHDGISPILGAGHELMLPPSSSLEWYAEDLKLDEQTAKKLTAFQKYSEFGQIIKNGNQECLEQAMETSVSRRIDQLIAIHPEHHLTDNEARAVAIEDLSRYWIYALVYRRNYAATRWIFRNGYFYGVHAPDVIARDGHVEFGDSHFVFIDSEFERNEKRFTEEYMVEQDMVLSRRRRVFNVGE